VISEFELFWLHESMLFSVRRFISPLQREDIAQEVGEPVCYTLMEHHRGCDAQLSKEPSKRKNVIAKNSAMDIEDLKIGDAVRVNWLDASETTRQLPNEEEVYDTPIRTYGVFLGVKGIRTKHMVIGKEFIEYDRTFHYNVIPIGMVEKVVLLSPADLDENLLKQLRKKIAVTPLKRFIIGVKGGLMQYE